ncbi:MAG: phosphopyruvate hydratase [Candidatus Nealsonbacteria bacterium CG02_land_8_20_14_3_00_37_10]|uniref:Enolase n=1 Tax=Candidatus Nealsonbacteria bacterium CG02_land_8_20_14_3_00_37_10 TaxID=1974699 RepID=A0A2M7DA29_9BACT|nr:MAG: phosphopyruvate hydratase [Candidatus Nealsonbacteria bacterium CG02_land_8_20_14_3_00_37_10]
MAEIRGIEAREILDSRGNPTVEVELTTGFGKFLASVPSGASKGKYEAVELRDEDGRGVSKAIKNIEKIIFPAIEKEDLTNQKRVDEILIKLDGTKNKSRLGANAILAVSMAVCRAGAEAKNLPLWKWISKLAKTKPSLPTPCILFIEGGLHDGGDLNLQEFMAYFPGKSFKERFKKAVSVYKELGQILSKRYGKRATRLGMEGAFIPPIKNTKEVLDLVMKIGGRNINIIIDAAASTFFKNGKYNFEKKRLSRGELLGFYLELCKNYPIAAIEDPFAQEDWQGFQSITKKLGKKITIIGDDFLVTNLQRIKEVTRKKACNGLILKPNQVGTVTETITAAKYAMKKKWKVFVKHRGGETKDDFIADLSVGLGTGFIMAGAPSKPERMAKYKRLVKIEEELK